MYMNNKTLLITILTTALLGSTWFFKSEIRDYARAWYFQIPFPCYSVVVERNVPILMKDGITLYADVYHPKTKKTHPIIVARTPYGKVNKEHHYEDIGRLFSGQGIAFLIQDVRGKYDSGGEFYPHRNDESDGSDTIRWVNLQPWSDKQIALFGFSYLGSAAWQAAKTEDPSIKMVIPWFTGSNTYQLWYDDRIPHLKQLLFWMCKYNNRYPQEIDHTDVDRLLAKATDWSQLDRQLVGKPIAAYQDFLKHTHNDDFWKKLSTRVSDLNPDVPVFLGSGWYDRFLKPTIKDFQTLQQTSSKPVQLILGPWAHNPTQPINQLSLGSDANFLIQFASILRWCQHHFFGIPLDNLAPVTYYVIGQNKWRTANEWPPRESVQAIFYFGEKDKLVTTPPKTIIQQLLFKPKELVPAIGGHMLYSNGLDGLQDQSFLSDRQDLLMWTTPPFVEETIVVGAPKLQLFLHTDAPGLDLMAKLIDISPDGHMQLITDGMYRLTQNDLNQSISQVQISLIDKAYTINKGHRIQIALTHSHFPSHAPNPKLQDIEEVKVDIKLGNIYPSQLRINTLPLEK